MREKNSCKHTATAWHSKKTESLGKEEIELLQTHFIAASLPRSDPLTLALHHRLAGKAQNQ